MAIKDIILKLIIDGKESIITLDKFDQKLGGLNKSVKNVAGALGLAFGAHQVLGFIKDSISLVQRQNEVVGKLNATLNSTRFAAGYTSDEIVKLAEHLEVLNRFKFDDKDIIDASGILLTFTKINKEVFPEALQLAMDMSVRFNWTLAASIEKVGRALEDPINGFSMLQKNGFSLSEQQKDLVKQFIKQNDLMKAQKVVLEELSQYASGAAAASVDAYTEKIGRLNKTLENAQERLGRFVQTLGIFALDALQNLDTFILTGGNFVQTSLLAQAEARFEQLRKQIISPFNFKEPKPLVPVKELTEAEKREIERRKKLEEDLYKELLIRSKEGQEKELEQLRLWYEERQKVASSNSELMLSLEEVYNSERQNIQIKYLRKELDLQLDHLKKVKESRERAERERRDKFGRIVTKTYEPVEKPDPLGGMTTEQIRSMNFELATMDALTYSISDGFYSAASAVSSAFGQSIKVFDKANSLLQIYINSLVQATLQALAFKSVSAFIGFLFGGPAGTALALPAFAEGGVVRKPTISLIGEAGPEAVIPLDRLNSVSPNLGSSGNLETLLNQYLRKIDEWQDSLSFEGELRGSDLHLSTERARKLRLKNNM